MNLIAVGYQKATSREELVSAQLGSGVGLIVLVIMMVTAQIHQGVGLGLNLVVLRRFVDRCLHLQSKPLKHLFVIGE